MTATSDASATHLSAHERDEERHESELERLDRNTVELLNELRVAATGVQVLFAFLLTVPFSNGYRRLDSFDRAAYFVTLRTVAAAAICLIAPSVHHRLLFARGEKPFIVRMGTQVAIAGAGFLAIGLTGIVVVISNVVFGALAAAFAGAATAASMGGLWFALPLRRRARSARRQG